MTRARFCVAIIQGIVLATVLSGAASASVTEIRQDFFNQTADLAATPILAAPTGDANYLIAVYESVGSASATPTLRWTDENGIPRVQTGAFADNGCQMLTFMRVKAGTQPTVETTGYGGSGTYTLYVSGLGFWSGVAQGQAGLSEVTGTSATVQLVYYATHSISGLLVGFSENHVGQQYFTWWDENGERVVSITPGSPIVTPVRIAGGTRVLAFDPSKAGLWYGLILFGAPGSGSGPFEDYEFDLLDWSNAMYPKVETAFNPGSTGRNVVLVMSNIAERFNSGSVNEQLDTSDQGLMPCGGAISAAPSGAPGSCVGPAKVGANVPLEFWTSNSPGSPWGPSPTYTAEVDLLQF
jgi:hypothetical protein